MEDERSKSLRLISFKGPVIPSNISKDIGKDLLFTAVILSELVRAGKLKVSNIKIGSSPLYYLPEHKQRLENFYKYLNEKDRRTFDLLREKQVLREKEQEPLIRVSLSNIKDFAVPLEVGINNEKEIFYKWHTLSNEDAAIIIKKIISEKFKPIEEIPEKQVEKPIEENKIEPTKIEEPNSDEKLVNQNEIQTEKPIEEKKVESETKKEEKTETPKVEKKKEPETQKKEEKAIIEKTEKPIEEKKVESETKKKENIINEKTEKEKKIKDFCEELPEDSFLDEVKEYFDKKGIEIIKCEIIKKKNEIDFIVNVNSKIGKLKYYSRAKNKKRISDLDIASAFVQSQVKKLPLLFVTSGELTKKTIEMMDKEFESVKLLQLE